MSGICGILRLDGGSPEGIEAMASRLERRGPEGTQHFRDGVCALGHTLLAATPEALHETMPLTHTETGCTITADLRLDNRDELMPALGLANAERVIGDGEIVLHAYLKWGEDCPLHLLGDFAFAIWDPRTQRIFAARDHMGMKQLIHCHVEGKVWAFASEPKAVLAANDIPKRINEGRIADFLENYLEGIDYTSTFFEEVSRLPPAHCLTVDSRGINLRRYWTLEPGPELKLGSDEEYAKAFLEVFTEAVRCRLRCNGPVGSMLSGGMDSGSVVAVASKILAEAGAGPLHTFSCLGPDSETCIETRTAWASINHVPGLKPHVADYTKLEPYVGDLIRLMKKIDEPFDGHMTLVRTAYLMAQRAGVRVVMDGGAGDCALPSVSRAAREFRAGNLRQVWREAEGASRFWGGTPTRHFFASGREAFTPNFVRHLRLIWQRRRDHLPQRCLIHVDFARRIRLAKRTRQFRKHSVVGLKSKKVQHVIALLNPYLVTGRERYDRVASALGVEPRDPFLDLRMIGFCLRLPAAQIDHDGWIKIVMRRSMSGLLPDATRWRLGKQHLGWMFTDRVLRGWPKWRYRILDRSQLSDYVRNSALRRCGQRAEEMLILGEDSTLLSLATWLGDVENKRICLLKRLY